MCTLMLKILDPIAVEYRSMVINSFGIVWMFRRKFSVFFNDSSKLEVVIAQGIYNMAKDLFRIIFCLSLILHIKFH
jgi:hypothetical protein